MQLPSNTIRMMFGKILIPDLILIRSKNNQSKWESFILLVKYATDLLYYVRSLLENADWRNVVILQKFKRVQLKSALKVLPELGRRLIWRYLEGWAESYPFFDLGRQRRLEARNLLDFTLITKSLEKTRRKQFFLNTIIGIDNTADN